MFSGANNTPTSNALPTGIRLSNYEITGQLGNGYAGYTYRAVNLDTGAPVAMKEYFPWPLAARGDGYEVHACDDAAEADFGWGLRRFIELGQGLTRLSFRTVATADEVFAQNGTGYIVSRFIDGPALTSSLAPAGRVAEETLLEFVNAVLPDLQGVHEAGFFHRDVCARNMLVDGRGLPRLVDFGTAGVSRKRRQRQAGDIPIKPIGAANSARETLRKGPWADIYGFARILFSLISGQEPAAAGGNAYSHTARGLTLASVDDEILADYSPLLLAAVSAGLAASLDNRPLTISTWLDLFPGRAGEISFHPVFLPAPTTKAESALADVTPMTATVTNHRVLVVDDEPFQCKVLLTLLGQIGITDCQGVNSAQEALDLIRTVADPFDVIICDLKMPDMDGLEFIRRVSESGTSPRIIFASGVGRSILEAAQNFAEAQNLHVLGALSKPIDRRQVASLLAQEFPGVDTSPPRADPVPTAENLNYAEALSGLHNNALTMYYQPKIDVVTNEITGFEALARWRDPKRGLLGPGAFLHVLEDGGLLDKFTEKVTLETLRNVAQWHGDGLDPGVSINIPAEILSDFGFPAFVIGAAADAGVGLDRITLELTESAVARDAMAAMEILTRFRLNGMTLSIDDFGTGYASLDKLKNLPFTELKIDRVFVHGAVSNHNARVLLETAIELGRKLNLNIVAEGVEDRADWDLVARLGCDSVQGYFVAKPMPADQVPVWLHEWQQGAMTAASR